MDALLFFSSLFLCLPFLPDLFTYTMLLEARYLHSSILPLLDRLCGLHAWFIPSRLLMEEDRRMDGWNEINAYPPNPATTVQHLPFGS